MNGTFTIQDLLFQQSHYRDEIKYVFSRQLIDEPVNYFEFINNTDRERMFYILREWEILFAEDNLIRLDTLTFDYIAQKLSVNKIINVADVQDLITDIRDNIQYFRKDNRNNMKYIHRIREMFHRVERKIRLSIDNLRANIDDTYKQVSEFEIKKKELDKLDKKRKAIQDIIAQTLVLINEERDFLCDNGMENRCGHIHRMMVDYGLEVSELHNLIINYLFRVEKQSERVKKIKKLKMLKDRHVLEVATDIESVLSMVKGYPIDGHLREETKISIDWLMESDEALNMLDKVRSEVKYKTEKNPTSAGKIEDIYLDREPVYMDMIDYDEILRGFLPQNLDLFRFVMSYPFEREMGTDDFIEIYSTLTNMYSEELDITDEFGYYNNYKYRIIKPLDK